MNVLLYLSTAFSKSFQTWITIDAWSPSAPCSNSLFSVFYSKGTTSLCWIKWPLLWRSAPQSCSLEVGPTPGPKTTKPFCSQISRHRWRRFQLLNLKLILYKLKVSYRNHERCSLCERAVTNCCNLLTSMFLSWSSTWALASSNFAHCNSWKWPHGQRTWYPLGNIPVGTTVFGTPPKLWNPPKPPPCNIWTPVGSDSAP